MKYLSYTISVTNDITGEKLSSKQAISTSFVDINTHNMVRTVLEDAAYRLISEMPKPTDRDLKDYPSLDEEEE